MTAAYGIAHRSPFIAGLGWFSLLDEPPSVPDGLTTGLMTWDGQAEARLLRLQAGAVSRAVVAAGFDRG